MTRAPSACARSAARTRASASSRSRSSQTPRSHSTSRSRPRAASRHSRREARALPAARCRGAMRSRGSRRARSGVAPPRASERIDLLLTTDLLSEGLDLGDASVVVHLDLPWTPARLEQRVGRSRRLGAPHARTWVYAYAPPAAAERLLGGGAAAAREAARGRPDHRRRRRDIAVARTARPTKRPPPARASACTRSSQRGARNALRSEQNSSSPPRTAAGARCCCAARDGAHTVLGASLDDGEPTDDPETLLAVAELAAAARDASPDARAIERALAAGARWLERRSASEAIGGAAIFRAASRRSALRRIAGIAQRAPHHRRALIAPMAAQARRVVAAPFGVGAERILDAHRRCAARRRSVAPRAQRIRGDPRAGPLARQQAAPALIAVIVIDVQ